MNEKTLLKKRYGIPAALLALLVLAGVGAAIVVTTVKVTTVSNTTMIEEPLSFAEKDSLNITHQGESDNIVVKATNHSTTKGYGIFVDAEIENENRVESIAYSSAKLVLSENAEGQNVNGDDDNWDAEYNIEADGTFDITLTVDSADNVAADNITITLDFYRGSKY